jgi:uncharacterized protein (TIGR02117 family)
MLRSMRWTARLLALAAGLLLLLLTGLVLGAVLPRNAGWQEAETGVIIHVDATPVHTELILPARAGAFNLTDFQPFADGKPGPFVGVSWGDRDFFVATPDWSDFDPGLAARALFASRGSLVHVYRLEAPSGHPVRLTPDQYRRLVAHLRAEVAPGASIPGYGTDDIFLPGSGRYSWWRTCNQWAADALAAAGVRVGRWTPLAQSLMWRFESGED